MIALPFDASFIDTSSGAAPEWIKDDTDISAVSVSFCQDKENRENLENKVIHCMLLSYCHFTLSRSKGVLWHFFWYYTTWF